MLRFLANIARAVGRAANLLTSGVFEGLMNTLYPGALDNAAAGVQDAHADVGSDLFEQAEDRRLSHELEMKAALAWTYETLAAGAPAEFPDPMTPRTRYWFGSLAPEQLLAVTQTRPGDVYCHVYHSLDADGLPPFRDTRPPPLSEAARYGHRQAFAPVDVNACEPDAYLQSRPSY